MNVTGHRQRPIKGRSRPTNPQSCFEWLTRDQAGDGWSSGSPPGDGPCRSGDSQREVAARAERLCDEGVACTMDGARIQDTGLFIDHAHSIFTRNDSPGRSVYAELIAQRFGGACRRLGLNRVPRFERSTAHFRVPAATGDQPSLL